MKQLFHIIIDLWKKRFKWSDNKFNIRSWNKYRNSSRSNVAFKCRCYYNTRLEVTQLPIKIHTASLFHNGVTLISSRALPLQYSLSFECIYIYIYISYRYLRLLFLRVLPFPFLNTFVTLDTFYSKLLRRLYRLYDTNLNFWISHWNKRVDR